MHYPHPRARASDFSSSWLARCPLTAVIAILLCNQGQASVRTVTNLNDSGAGSLRAVLGAAVAGDIIQFAEGLAGTLTLTSGELLVSVDLTISGPGAKSLTIDGNNMSRVFNVTAGSIQLSGLALTRGSNGGFGGGIRIASGATVAVTACTFSNNNAHDGGGISNQGTLNVTNATFFGNGFDSGGGLLNRGTATVVNCTFANNQASIGAGIYNQLGTLTLRHCTISGNSSGGSPGGLSQAAAATIANSIIAGNTFVGFPMQPQDVGGAVSVTSLGHNLIGKTNGSSGWVSSDLKGSIAAPLNAQLGPFQDNGGPTFTFAPLPASPALDAAASGGPAADQRGHARPYDHPAIVNAAGSDGSDIGAVEIGAGEQPKLIVYNINDSGAGSLRQAIVNVKIYGVGTIEFAETVSGTIILTSGELLVTNTMAIRGPGADIVTVSGNGASRVFAVTNGTVSAEGLTIADAFFPFFGGGIYNSTNLRLTNCMFAANNAADGGAIYNGNTGTLLVVGSAFVNNLSSTGGALENRGTATLLNCSLSGNQGNNGSAIYSSTLGSLTLTHATLVRNGNAGSTYAALYAFAGTTMLQNTLIALNANSGLGGPDVLGTIISGGHNLIGKTNNSSGWVASDLKGSILSPLDPMVGVIQDNGGPTWTAPLRPSSPALDAGTAAGLTADQRGRPRPYDITTLANAPGSDGSDIGAYELFPPVLSSRLSGTSVLISWSRKESGYTLEFATVLGGGALSWTSIPGMPAAVGDRLVVTEDVVPGAQRFYRLHGP